MPTPRRKPDTEDRRDYLARMQMPLVATALPLNYSWHNAMTNVRDRSNL